jgi:tetratricopeptide (TPR) repeat protein
MYIRVLAVLLSLFASQGFGEPNDDHVALKYYLDGLMHEQMGDFKSAGDAYLIASEHDSSSIEIFLSLGSMYQKINNFSDAELTFEYILQLEPENTDALEALIDIKIMIQDWDLSIIYINRLANLKGDSELLILKRANVYGEKGDRLLEAESLIKLWQLNHDYIQALQRAELIYMELHEYAKIVRLYDFLLELMPENKELVSRQIHLLIGMHQFEKADSLINKELKINPISDQFLDLKIQILQITYGEYAAIKYLEPIMRGGGLGEELLLKLGNLYMQSGDYRKAVISFNAIIEEYPLNVEALSFLAISYASQEKYDLAAETILSRLEDFQDDVELRLLLTSLLVERFNVEKDNNLLHEAIDILDELVALNPNNLRILQNYVRVAQLLDNKEKVFQIYEKIIGTFPEDHLSKNNYAYIMATAPGIEHEELMYAADLVKEALELSPNNPAYLDTGGWIFHLLGHHQIALKYIEQAYLQTPDDEDVRIHLKILLKYLQLNDKYDHYFGAPNP